MYVNIKADKSRHDRHYIVGSVQQEMQIWKPSNLQRIYLMKLVTSNTTIYIEPLKYENHSFFPLLTSYLSESHNATEWKRSWLLLSNTEYRYMADLSAETLVIVVVLDGLYRLT